MVASFEIALWILLCLRSIWKSYPLTDLKILTEQIIGLLLSATMHIFTKQVIFINYWKNKGLNGLYYLHTTKLDLEKGYISLIKSHSKVLLSMRKVLSFTLILNAINKASKTLQISYVPRSQQETSLFLKYIRKWTILIYDLFNSFSSNFITT